MADFRNLEVWHKAHALSLQIHHAASCIRGITYTSRRSQLVRAAMSIPANIVEGREKESEREFMRYLRIALSSATELEYHLITAYDFGVMSLANFNLLQTETVRVRKMLHRLIERIERDRRGNGSS